MSTTYKLVKTWNTIRKDFVRFYLNCEINHNVENSIISVTAKDLDTGDAESIS